MMRTIKYFLETVLMGLFAVLLFPVVLIGFVGYLLYLAFCPVRKSSNEFEGWMV